MRFQSQWALTPALPLLTSTHSHGEKRALARNTNIMNTKKTTCIYIGKMVTHSSWFGWELGHRQNDHLSCIFQAQEPISSVQRHKQGCLPYGHRQRTRSSLPRSRQVAGCRRSNARWPGIGDQPHHRPASAPLRPTPCHTPRC